MKKIAIGLISAIISSSVFAIHGEGFKIISESHKVSGENAKGWLETDKGNDPKVKYVSAKAQTYNEAGYIRQNIQLQGNHFYDIHNQTGRTQRYKVHYSIDCIGASNVHDIELEIIPDGWVDETAINYLLVQPTQKGQFLISVSTSVSGESSQVGTGSGTLRVN